ncbi:hypothetical protein [Massilia sp. TN1-12]|uniref:hypothetical protein n=1 Tax=Massilia paldalensis TaxID=3377675 RepID=UPI00384F8EA3
MNDRPALTREDLKAIHDRNRGDEDVVALLWEIHRLRALALRSHDFFRQPPTSTTGTIMAQSLFRLLEEEPVVKEQPKL